mmetsp:Transcript_7753/g.11088  ORF Transcript_7753/g.11088 Transcript_7753/m.11088 type:complete len:89 (-) Transcript_7753:99-365(-)
MPLKIIPAVKITGAISASEISTDLSESQAEELVLPDQLGSQEIFLDADFDLNTDIFNTDELSLMSEEDISFRDDKEFGDFILDAVQWL